MGEMMLARMAGGAKVLSNLPSGPPAHSHLEALSREPHSYFPAQATVFPHFPLTLILLTRSSWRANCQNGLLSTKTGLSTLLEESCTLVLDNVDIT